jgi:pimeloyl-ACP methyl ester carboxylesterase
MNSLQKITKILIIFLFFVHQSNAQESSNNLIGNWSGKIELPMMKLEIIFKISMDENGKPKATFDVPVQGAKNLPVGEVLATADSLILNVPVISGTYNGEIVSNDSIAGKWFQSGRTMPLNLKKIEIITELNRPQTPEEPFPYSIEELEYTNPKSGFKLAGTLTLPKNANNCPAVVLISGSGAQDRDESIFEHKPFWVIADYFARNGIAVLRVDDRGVGGSEGNIREATSKDFAVDVSAGVNILKSYGKIDQSKIGLIGHSEGGLIAPIVATTNQEIAFLVMMAGPGIIGSEILIEQGELLSRAAGMPESAIAQNQQIIKAMVDILMNEKDSAKALDRLQRTFSGGTYPMLDEKKKKLIDAKVAGINTPWFRYFLSYDPFPTLTKVTCPVLALAGEKDLQVPAKANLAAINKALVLGVNQNFKTMEMENLNHLFQNCEKGTVAEYGQIEETIDPKVLETMKDWIWEVTKK